MMVVTGGRSSYSIPPDERAAWPWNFSNVSLKRSSLPRWNPVARGGARLLFLIGAPSERPAWRWIIGGAGWPYGRTQAVCGPCRWDLPLRLHLPVFLSVKG